MDGNELHRVVLLFATTHHLELVYACFLAEYLVATQVWWTVPLLLIVLLANARLTSNAGTSALAMFSVVLVAKVVWPHSLLAVSIACTALLASKQAYSPAAAMPSDAAPTTAPRAAEPDDVTGDQTCLYLF